MFKRYGNGFFNLSDSNITYNNKYTYSDTTKENKRRRRHLENLNKKVPDNFKIQKLMSVNILDIYIYIYISLVNISIYVHTLYGILI